MDSKPPRKNSFLDIDIEEVEKLLNTSVSEDPNHYHNDVFAFMAAFNIQAGDNLVSDWFLYELYRKWTRDPIGDKLKFKQQLSKLLEPVITGHEHHVTHYKINLSGFLLSQRMYQLSKAKVPRDPEKNPNYRRHFEAFMKRYDIKRGSYWISHDCLYHLYDCWSHNKYIKFSRTRFYKIAKLYFEEKRNTGSVWFAVDNSILRFISEEQITQVQEGTKKTYDKKAEWLKKGRGKKSQHKVSRTTKRREPKN